jgi:uncharacterized MAPEG superfamily protein
LGKRQLDQAEPATGEKEALATAIHLYLPIYVMGVIYVRTALWGVAVIGLLMMLVRLVWS